jgi:hypothetical protein
MTATAKLIASAKVEDGFAVIRIPLPEVHGLVVALGECPCKAVKSASTKSLRVRLRRALIKLQSQGMKK